MMVINSTGSLYIEKKSSSGISTPTPDIELIKKRIKLAIEIKNDKKRRLK